MHQVTELEQPTMFHIVQKLKELSGADPSAASLTPDEVSKLLKHLLNITPHVTVAGDPEAQRREAPTISGWPLKREPGDESPLLDYGTAGGLIDRAKHHLDEALPGGQKLRAVYAYEMLVRGVADLGEWMVKKGYYD